MRNKEPVDVWSQTQMSAHEHRRAGNGREAGAESEETRAEE